MAIEHLCKEKRYLNRLSLVGDHLKIYVIFFN